MSDYPFISIDGFEMPGGGFVRRDRDGRMLFGDAEVPEASLLDLLSGADPAIAALDSRVDALEEDLAMQETYIFSSDVILAHGGFGLSLYSNGLTRIVRIVEIIAQNILVAANGSPKLFEIRFRRFSTLHSGGTVVVPTARDPANNPALLASSHLITGITLGTVTGLGGVGRKIVLSNDNVSATTLNSPSNQSALSNHNPIFRITHPQEPITLRQGNGLGLEILSQTGSFGAQPGLYNMQIVCTVVAP